MKTNKIKVRGDVFTLKGDRVTVETPHYVIKRQGTISSEVDVETFKRFFEDRPELIEWINRETSKRRSRI